MLFSKKNYRELVDGRVRYVSSIVYESGSEKVL